MNTKDIEEIVEQILVDITNCDGEQEVREMLQEHLTTLTQHHQAEVERAYERGVADGIDKPLLAIENVREAERERILQILWQIDYDVDVDKTPTISDEAWANQYDSKAEAFWYGEAEGVKTFKKAIELISKLRV